MVKQVDNSFQTTVYVKPTNVGRCLNARGECPDSYKRSVDAAYAKRAFTHTTSWEQMHRELERVRQMLTNNGFQDGLIVDVIAKVLEKHIVPNQNNNLTDSKRVILSHCMTYGSMFEQESAAIRRIVKRGVTPVDSHGEFTLRIYCRSDLTSSLVMKNNNAPKPTLENETNVVYRFECTVGNCRGRNVDYIGLTATTLKARMKTTATMGPFTSTLRGYTTENLPQKN